MTRSQPEHFCEFAWQRLASLSILALCALGSGVFAAEVGAFSFNNFTAANQMSDTNVGLLSTKTYQNAANINGVALTINGVAFSATTSAIAGTNWALTGAATSFPSGNTHNLVTGQLGLLINDFTYGGNPGVLTLSGLTTGTTYIVTLYHAAFGPIGGRVMSTVTANDGASILNFDANGSGDDPNGGNGQVLRYTFVATGATAVLTFTPLQAGNTNHFYGFSNETVFNKAYTSGANYSTAVFAPTGAPSAQGANVNFNAAAGGSVNIDAPVTLGHVQFAATNAYNLTGTNSITLFADAGGISVLNSTVAAGSHTIAAPVIFNNTVMKMGPGAINLTGGVAGVGALLIKNGTLALGGTNTYTAATTVNNAGTLKLLSNNATSAPAATGTGVINLNTTLDLNGFSTVINSLNGAGTVNTVSGGTPTLTLGANGDSGTFTGTVTNAAGTLSVVKTGTGKASLSGVNTYTGTTIVNLGTLSTSSLSSSAVIIGSGLTPTATAGNGTLTINGNATIGTASSGTLTIAAGNIGATPIGQGTLSMLDGVPNTMTFLNNTATTVFTTGSSTAGNTSVINMEVGSLSDQIILPANAQISAGSAGTIVNITGLGGLSGQRQTLITAPGGFSSGSFANFTLGSLSGNFNGFTVALSFDATHLYLNLTGTVPLTAYWNGTVDSNWFTYTSNPTTTNWIAAPQGLELGATPGTTTDVFFTSDLANTTRLNTSLGGGGASINSLTFTGGNTSAFLPITIANGTLTLNSGNGITVQTGSGSHTITSAVAINANQTWSNADLLNTLTVSGPVTGPAFNLTTSGAGSFLLSGNNSYANTTIGGGILQIGGGGTTGTLGTGPVVNSGALRINRSNALTIPNIISGTGPLVQQGVGGTTVLSGANTYTGTTTIQAGTLSVSSLNKILGGTASSNLGTPPDLTAGTIAIGSLGNAAGLRYTGTGETTDRPFTLPGTTGTVTLDQSGTGTFGIGITGTPGSGIKTLSLIGSTAGVGTLNGVVADADATNITTLAKSGTGTWNVTGTNTYTGETIFAGGILNVASLSDFGVPSAIGARLASQENGTVTGVSLHFQGGTLQYTGSTPQSTNRQMRMLNGNGAFIDASGSTPTATLNFTYSGTNLNLFDTAGTRTLTLTGTNNGLNTFANQVTNQGTNASGITKTGTGRWLLTGTHTYTGNTTVSAGTLQVTNSIAMGIGSVVVGNVAGKAALTIVPGANISNTTTSGFTAGTVAGATGAVNITGGTLALAATANDPNFCFGANAGGFGGLNMSGGTVNVNRFQIGGLAAVTANGTGVCLISGGTLTAAEYILIGRNTGAIGVLTVTGGNVIHTPATQNLALAWGGGRAELNIAGGTIDNTGKSVSFRQGGAGTATGIVNLNAGTLKTDSIGSNPATATCLVNLNGGTLATTSSLVNYFQPATFSYVNGPFGTFNGGAVIDTGSFTPTIAANLLAPTGSGVTAIPVTTGGAGYVCAPYVAVTDATGSGITAIANMADDGGGTNTLKISSITITNPGVDCTGPITVTLTGGGAATAATFGTATLTPNVSGGLTKNGSGTLTLSGASTYSGPTTVNAGILKSGAASVAGVSGAFGLNSVLTLANTANVGADITGFNTTVGSLSGGGTTGGGVALGAATLTVGSDNTTTGVYAGVISGTGALAKTGTGTQTLTGANTYTGGTNILNGSLVLGTLTGSTVGSLASGSTVILGDAVANTSGVLVLGDATNPADQSLSSLTTAGTGTANAVVGGNTLTSTLTLNTPADVIFAGQLGGASGSQNKLALTKSGTGALTLTGNNSYSGPTTVSVGALIVNGTHTGAGAFSVTNGAVLGGTGTIAASVTSTGGVINPGAPSTPGVLSFSGATAPLTFDSTTTLNLRLTGAPSATVGSSGNDGILATAGTINLGNVQINVSGLTVSGDYRVLKGSALSGSVVIASATLGFAVTPDTSTVPGTLILHVISAPVRTWTGGGADQLWTNPLNWDTVPNGNSNETLVFPAVTNKNATVNGTLIGKSFGSLVFQAGGYVIDGGAIKTDSSGPFINNLAGANAVNVNLTLTSANSFASIAGTLTIGLAANTIDNGGFALTLSGGSAITINSVLSGTGTLVDRNTGVSSLTAANTYTGKTSVLNGTLSINSLANAGSNCALGAPAAANATIDMATSTTLQFVNSASASSNRIINLLGAATLDASTVGGGVQTLTGNITGTQNLTLTGAVPGSATLTGTLGIGATSALTKSGGGTWTLTQNASVGTVTVSGGSLLGAAILTSSGTFEMQSGTVGVALAGAAIPMNKTGAGTVILNGANTFAGPTTITLGVLQLGNANAAQNSTVAVNVSGGLTFSGGVGTFNIGSLGTSSGNIVLSDLASAAVTLVAGSNNASTNYTGVLSGLGGISKAGTGTLTLGGTNTNDGPTSITGGTLKAGNAAALGSSVGGTSISGGGTLDINGFSLGNEVVTVSGTGVGGNGAIINSGAAQTQALTALTLNGNTLINATNRWDLRGSPATLDMGGFTLSVTGGTSANGFHLTSNLTTSGVNVLNPGNFIVLGTASLHLEQSTTINGSGTNTITLNTGTYLGLFNNIQSNLWTVNATAATIANSGGGASTWTGPIALTGSNTMDTTGGNLTLNGVISGAGSLTKTAVNSLALFGANTFTGDTRIVAGTLQLDASTGSTTNALAASTLDMNLVDAGILNFGASALTAVTSATFAGLKGSRNITLTNTNGAPAGVAVTIGGNGSSTTYTGVLSGLGSLIKTGAGTFSLGSTQTYSGPTTIAAGKIVLASVTAPPPGATTIFTFNSGNVQDSSGNGNNGAVTGTPTFVPGTIGTALNLNNTISQQYMTVPYNAASLGLNAYTISLWINPTSVVQNANATLASTRNGGETTFDLQLTSTGTAITGLHGDIGTGAAWLTTAANATATITPGVWTMVTYTVNNLGYSIYVNGSLVASGVFTGSAPVLATGAEELSFGHQKAGGGAYGGANAYNGALDEIYIYGSVLNAAQINTLYQSSLKSNLPATTALQIASGATFDLNGFNQAIGSLADFNGGGGSVVNSNATTPLAFTLNSASGLATFSGVISDAGAANAISLIKNGSSSQVLSGANTYSGGTTVSGGALALTGTGTIGTAGNPLRISNGATLDLGATTQTVGQVNGPGAGNGVVGSISNGTLNISNATIYVQSGTITASLSGLGGTRMLIGGDASATVNLGGVNSIAFIDHHSISIGDPTTGVAGTVKLLTATAIGPNTETLSLFDGVLDLNGQQNVTVGTIFMSNGTTSHLINNNSAQAATFGNGIQINSPGTDFGGLGDIVAGGVVSGSGGVSKSGIGVLSFTGNNTYGATTIITAGSLQIGKATASGTLGIGAVTNSGTLIFNRTDAAFPVSNVITGSGSLVQSGTGTTTLSGANNYSGPTTVSAGTLLVSAGGTIAPSTTTVATGGTLGGTGSVGSVVVNGTLSPGIPGFASDIGTLTVQGNVSFNAGSKFIVDINSAFQTDCDLLDLSNGSLSVAGGTLVIRTPVFAASPAIQYQVASYSTVQPGSVKFLVNQTANQTGSTAGVGYDPAGTIPPKYIYVNFGGSVTPVTVGAFSSQCDGAGVRLDWTAVSEFQNAGFNLYRRAVQPASGWTRINPALIAGRITSADEKKYAFCDWAPAGVFEYKLESVSLSGEREAFYTANGAVLVDSNTESAISADSIDAALRSIALSGNVDSTRQFADAYKANAITTDRAPGALEMKIYDVGELAPSTVQHLIKSSMRQDAWDSAQGMAIEALHGKLMVVQSPENHALIKQMLSRMYAAPKSVSKAASPREVNSTTETTASVRWFSSTAASTTSGYVAAKVVYGQSGVLLIPQSSLPSGFDANHVTLQREGRALTALALTPDGLLVYAPGYEDDYTDKDSLFLRKTNTATPAGVAATMPNLFVSPLPANVTSPASTNQDYHEVYFDYDLRPYNFAPWFSSKYLTQGTTQDFTLNLQQATGGPATLTVNLWSLTSFPTATPDHQLMVAINGILVGQTQWNGGGKMMQLSFSVPAGVVRAGDNTVSLATPAIEGLDEQISFLHSFTASYTRLLNGSQPLEIINSGNSPQLYELANVPAAGVWVVDTRFADRAALVPTELQSQSDGSTRARFIAAPGGSGAYCVTPKGQENLPLSVTKRTVAPVRSTAAYLAAGPAQFAAGVQPLLAQHNKEGIRSTFVDQEQLFDYYNYGRFGPAGIQKAVRSLRPSYLLLVGRTTYDYKNYSGMNVDPLCPTFLIPTSFWAQSTSDSRFGDLGRGYPEVAIGRLPVNNVTELSGAVTHVLNYKGIPDSGFRLHAVADKPDPTLADFGAQLDAMLKANHPDVVWQENYLERTWQTLPEVTAAMRAAAGGGADLILYSGHGNASRLGDYSRVILDQTKVQEWTGNTIFLQSTCTANWMAANSAGYKSIAIQALTQPQGGISAGIGTSTYMNPDAALSFMNQLLKGAKSGNARWGSVLMKTQQWAGAQNGSGYYNDLMNTEQLFGDPAMPVMSKPRAPGSAPASGAVQGSSGTAVAPGQF